MSLREASREEITLIGSKQAIKKKKKIAGEDEISSEMLKAADDTHYSFCFRYLMKFG